MARRAILLDVMGTLVQDPFYDAVLRFFGMSMQELLEEKDADAWPRFERGELSREEFYERMFSDGRSFDHRALEAALYDAYAWIDGMEPLLAELKFSEAPMHALSNYPVWYELIERRLGLSRYVSWTFVSCKTGLRKPQREAFLSAARALGLQPAECLLVDDRPENCFAAERVGMPALLFSGAESLAIRLRDRGWLPPRR